MITDQFGNLAVRSTIPMNAEHIRGICDGKYFALHPDLLEDIRLELVCEHCRAAGLLGEIHTTRQADRLNFRCGHRSGYISTARPSDFSHLLATLGWSLCCSLCGTEVDGDNTIDSPTLDVSCPCTIRRLANPLAPVGTA